MSNAWISRKARYTIYARDGYTCCYCGKHCHKAGSIKDYPTLDHIIPRVEIAKACENDKEFNAACRNPHNLVTICMSCNASKQETALEIWCEKKGLNYIAIRIEIEMRIS